MRYTLKQRVGAAALDWPPFEARLRRSWTQIRNRDEVLRRAPDGSGVECRWRWTSDLHVAKVFPSLGLRLMRRATADWPIAFAEGTRGDARDVQVSFIVGHRGTERLSQLLATLATIAAQSGARIECIVVEQSVREEVRERMPRWVRYVHTPVPDPAMPYCRAWTFNVGARLARGSVLVFHDGDLLVPRGYAVEAWRRIEQGFEAVNLKRFIFFLTERHSREVEAGGALTFSAPPEAIMQNAESGGSVALARDAFFAIGGYDESFVGWGGEDNELWERAQTLAVWPFGYLPFVHLWHTQQSEKHGAQRELSPYYRRRASTPPRQRIAELKARRFGDPQHMDPAWPPPAPEGR